MVTDFDYWALYYFDFSKYELVVASGQTDIRSYDLEQLASQQETKNNLADDSQKEDSENTEDDTEAVEDYETLKTRTVIS